MLDMAEVIEFEAAADAEDLDYEQFVKDDLSKFIVKVTEIVDAYKQLSEAAQSVIDTYNYELDCLKYSTANLQLPPQILTLVDEVKFVLDQMENQIEY